MNTAAKLDAIAYPDAPEYEDDAIDQTPIQSPIEDLKNVAQRVVLQDDSDRINAATNLVNTWNYAVQVQANRPKWQPSDYRAFAIALVALDSVGKTATEQNDILDTTRDYFPVNQS